MFHAFYSKKCAMAIKYNGVVKNYFCLQKILSINNVNIYLPILIEVFTARGTKSLLEL